MIMVSTDLTCVHYRPAKQLAWCGAMSRVYQAKAVSEVMFEYPHEHIKQTTDVSKATCPECLRRIIAWANNNLNKSRPADDA